MTVICVNSFLCNFGWKQILLFMTDYYIVVIFLLFLVSIPFISSILEKWEAKIDEKERQKAMEEQKEREKLEEGNNLAL